MSIKNKQRARLALAELEKEMEILTKEEMNACKGGTDGSTGYSGYFSYNGSSGMYDFSNQYPQSMGYPEGSSGGSGYYGPHKKEDNWRYNYSDSLWGTGFPAPYLPPEGVTVYGNPLARIRFSNSANQDAVSSYSLQILNSVLGNENIVITSTARDPYNQARVMYDNIVRTGDEVQMGIYRDPGQSVIAVYNEDLSREENIRNMENQINAVGPSAVSKHCADLNILNVMDISKSSIQNIEEFKRRLTSAGIDWLDENGCIHIEIKQ